MTISKNQYEHVKQLFAGLHGDRTKEVRFQAWQEFDGEIDRVFMIGSFEHFGFETYPEFFRKMYAALPEDGRILLHTIVAHDIDFYRDNGIALTISDLKFILFMAKVIFPGCRLPSPEIIQARSSEAGFKIERIQKLGQHYARTLDIWHANLLANREEAIRVAGQLAYDYYDMQHAIVVQATTTNSSVNTTSTTTARTMPSKAATTKTTTAGTTTTTST